MTVMMQQFSISQFGYGNEAIGCGANPVCKQVTLFYGAESKLDVVAYDGLKSKSGNGWGGAKVTRLQTPFWKLNFDSLDRKHQATKRIEFKRSNSIKLSRNIRRNLSIQN